jgi:DNA-directed RNA polymerase subunit RPC12/RpoP
MRDGFAIVASYPNGLLARVAKTKLDDEGIENFIANEHTIGMDYFYSQALGGVQLWVPEPELQRARTLLQEEHSSEIPEILGPSSDVACPKCKSKNVSKHLNPSKLTVAFFFLGIPLPFFKKEWRCFQCGNRW